MFDGEDKARADCNSAVPYLAMTPVYTLVSVSESNAPVVGLRPSRSTSHPTRAVRSNRLFAISIVDMCSLGVVHISNQPSGGRWGMANVEGWVGQLLTIADEVGRVEGCQSLAAADLGHGDQKFVSLARDGWGCKPNGVYWYQLKEI